MNRLQQYKNKLISLWNYLDIDCCDDYLSMDIPKGEHQYFLDNVGISKRKGVFNDG